MSMQQFCLRWNNHQPNFISVFSSLLHNEALVDVTLAAEGRQLQAHKVVLSACSSYFQSLFTSNPCQHPIVILKDVQYSDLKTMVDFMYYGEVNVSQDQLPHVLKTAEMLKIKGLAEMPEGASVTKTENNCEQTEQLTSGSGTDSMWGSNESQQQYQQQQQQMRRSPSPAGGVVLSTPSAQTSTATRRKRLRKASTGSGSADRTSDEHIDNGSTVATLGLSQIDPMFGGGAGATSSGGNLVQNMQNPVKILKESSNSDNEGHHQHHHHHHHQHHQHHDSSQEGGSADDHHLQQNVIQMPIEITGSTTPTDHGGGATVVTCSPQQQTHGGVQWTVVDSGYPRFALSNAPTTTTTAVATNNIGLSASDGSVDGSGASNQQQTNAAAASAAAAVAQAAAAVAAAAQTTQIMQYQTSGSGAGSNGTNSYSPQIISVNPNNIGYHHQTSTEPQSPQHAHHIHHHHHDSDMIQTVYTHSTPNQSPTNQQQQQQQQQVQVQQQTQTPRQNANATNAGSAGQPTKRKRSVNPQGDENFLRALDAVRFGGIGFCKAARLYGVNNRTLWLEYKKRGYPISRPSIKNRIKLENMTPPPPSTPTNEENTSMETYEQNIQQQQVLTTTTEAQTSIMCAPPHAHPTTGGGTPTAMGVMSFLDARHVEFPMAAPVSSSSTSVRTRYPTATVVDGSAVNVNATTMNIQGINFNTM